MGSHWRNPEAHRARYARQGGLEAPNLSRSAISKSLATTAIAGFLIAQASTPILSNFDLHEDDNQSSPLGDVLHLGARPQQHSGLRSRNHRRR